jgi:hypothetical protein
MRRWCGGSFSTLPELLDHLTPCGLEEHTKARGFTIPCLSCGESNFTFEVLRRAADIEGRLNSSKMSTPCAVAIALRVCSRQACTGKKAEWYTEYWRGSMQTKVLIPLGIVGFCPLTSTQGKVQTAVIGLTPYFCPHDGICQMKFSDKQHLSAHLSDSIVDENEFATFCSKLSADTRFEDGLWESAVEAISGSGLWTRNTCCIYCGTSVSYRPSNIRKLFQSCHKIQVVLNSGKIANGISPCVAKYVIGHYTDSLQFCVSCKHRVPDDYRIYSAYPMQKAYQQYDKVEDEQRSLIEGRIPHCGKEHPLVLQNTVELSKTCIEQGKWDEGEKAMSEVVNTSVESLDQEHPDTLASMSFLASIYQHLQRWEEAEGLLSRVLVARIESLGKTHPLTTQCWDSLRTCQQHIASAPDRGV